MANSFIINDVDVISISTMGRRQIFGELQYFVTLSIMDLDGNEIGISLANDDIAVLIPLTKEVSDGLVTQIEEVDSIAVSAITASDANTKPWHAISLIIKDAAGHSVDIKLSNGDVAILQTLLKNGGVSDGSFTDV